MQFVGQGSFDSDTPPVPGTLVSGTRRNGVWRVVIPMSHCEFEAGGYRAVISAHDHAFNLVEKTIRWRVRNTDVIQPDIGLGVADVRPTGPLTVRFSEPVVGLSDTSAPIRPNAASAALGERRALGAPVSGRWVCLASGTVVDCANSAYRDARWTPDAPMEEGSYVLDASPEHIST